MSDEKDIEKEIRDRRKFSMEDAISDKMKGMFKNASVIPKLKTVQLEIQQLIKKNIPDNFGAIHRVLMRRVKNSNDIVHKHFDKPHMALKEIIEHILERDTRLYEFVRAVDQYYGEAYGERPHFQMPGKPAHPDDNYTHESVREALTKGKDKL